MGCNRNRPDINTTTVGARGGGGWGAVYTGCHCPVTAGQKGGGVWEMDIRDPPWAQANFRPPPTGRSGLSEGIMCTPEGAAATAEGIGTIKDGYSENCQGQVRHFGGFIAFFCLHCIQLLQ